MWIHIFYCLRFVLYDICKSINTFSVTISGMGYKTQLPDFVASEPFEHRLNAARSSEPSRDLFLQHPSMAPATVAQAGVEE